MKNLLYFLLIMFVGCANPSHEHLPVCMVSPGVDGYAGAGKYGITYYTDLDKAKECSVSTGRKILLMFSAYYAQAVEGQEWEILREESVRKLIDDQFILVVLFADDKTPIPVTYNSFLQDSIRTTGAKNSVLEHQNFEQNSIPYYVVVDTALNAIVPGSGYTRDSEEFSRMLESTLAR